MLRVYDPAFEVTLPREVRFVALVIVIVPGAAHQETGGIVFGFTGRFIQRGELPALVDTGPVRGFYRQTVADVPLDIILPGGLTHVILDRGAVRQHLTAGPRAEVVAEGEHVGVGADTGITEQIPGTAKRLTALQDGKGLSRTLALQVTRHANAGNAGADDQDVKMVLAHGCGLANR